MELRAVDLHRLTRSAFRALWLIGQVEQKRHAMDLAMLGTLLEHWRV